MSITLMLVLFFAFMALGMPIAHCMGLAAILAILIDGQLPVLILAQQYYEALDNFSLLAVPLFVLAGELMSVAGITERLVNMSRALIGHLRGGLAQANITTNMFMGAISGSALADLTAIGSIMIPAMKREGYKPAFAVAVTACAAMMAPMASAARSRAAAPPVKPSSRMCRSPCPTARVGPAAARSAAAAPSARGR
jgi:C4-dicarboxylate transporter DctM subunit